MANYLEYINYFGMYKLFWDTQINLECVNYFGMRKLFWDA